ncbi:hypothetical protein ACIHFC_00580 [Streptomyces sp. NPDC052013]|uniref:hypothetical protein n=1 Tax=Streptomyces sp. NPDC052013 TaxID=3365679 RepID=UPI0037D3AC16
MFAAALAFPVAATTAASANPNSDLVVLRGTVSCARFGAEFVPTSLSVSAGVAGTDSTAINAAASRASYAGIQLSPVPPGAGTPATATLTCTSTVDGLDQEIVRNFQLVRPAGNTVNATLNVF